MLHRILLKCPHIMQMWDTVSAEMQMLRPSLWKVNTSVCVCVHFVYSFWLEWWKQRFAVILSRSSLIWHWQSYVAVRTSSLSLQKGNICHYVGMFMSFQSHLQQCQSEGCFGMLYSVCTLCAVLQLLKLSVFKHHISLSTIGIEITWFHFCR